MNHNIVSVETQNRLVRCRCQCGWSSGWRAAQAVAHAAHLSHRESMLSMTEARALAIFADHRAGLHEEYAHPAGCMWIGCEDAFWTVVRAEERRQAEESFSE